MVTGWFLSIRELRVGMREPREPRTLPNRTDLYEPEYEVANQDVSPSAIDFDLPSALMGSAALSVEMLTKVLTPLLREASRTFRVPMTFVFHASAGNFSRAGKCLRAAA